MTRHSRRLWLKLAALASAGGLLGLKVAEADRSATSATVHLVRITGFVFEPATITIKVGDTVTWINNDIAPHTATAADNRWDTGELKFGESVSIVFNTDTMGSTQTVKQQLATQQGDSQEVRQIDKHLEYFCEYHPMMKGKITVLN